MDLQTLKHTRQEEILQSLSKLEFASRSQLQKIHHLGSNRNACRVLKDMEEYVNSFYDGENIYYLNHKGAKLIGYNGPIKTKSMSYKHILMRNDLYIYYDQPDLWRNEQEVTLVEQKLTIKADAFFKHSRTSQRFFVEIDNKQFMIENKRKIERYKALYDSKAVHKKFGSFPTLLWVTTSKLRKEQLESYCHECGLKTQVYLREEII